MAGMVADVVRESGTYSTNPGQQPVNRDFVEYFLTESNKGYCVHFASATVAMLRALGVPARYAEGYVVRESDFDESGVAEARRGAPTPGPRYGFRISDGFPWNPRRAVMRFRWALLHPLKMAEPMHLERWRMREKIPGRMQKPRRRAPRPRSRWICRPTAGSGEGAGALWWILPICAAAGVGALFLIPAARRAKRSRILQHAEPQAGGSLPI